MKLLLTTLLGFVSFIFIDGQSLDIEYLDCTDCPLSSSSVPLSSPLFSMGQTPDDWEVSDIISDYSKRIVASGNDWHNGIDLRDHIIGNSHRGDAIISPENGEVTMIRANGNYKYLVIAGSDQDQSRDFAYGHIFQSSQAIPFRLGNFVLSRVDPLEGSPTPYTIIDLVNCIAYCEENGRTVTLPNLINCSDELTTTNIVSAGGYVAPIGSSSTNAVHVHLYKLRNTANPSGQLYDAPGTWKEGMDPLTSLSYPQLDYEVQFAVNQEVNLLSFNSWGTGQIDYTDDPSNSVGIRVAMLNAMQVGDKVDRYSNGAFVVDDVNLLIKQTWENPLGYEKVIGPFFESNFSLGASRENGFYPDRLRLDNVFGSRLVTGIDPYAYKTQGNEFRPYDCYYFSDFKTRIHISDIGGDANGTGQRADSDVPITYADCPDVARYPDGKYSLMAEAITIENDTFSSDSMVVYLDNFKPYIKSINVSVGGVEVYEQIWACESSCGGVLAIANGVITGQQILTPISFNDVEVSIETSEPLYNLSLEVEYDNQVVLSTSPGSLVEVDASRRIWDFSLDLSDNSLLLESLFSTNFEIGELMKFKFEGHDYDPQGNQGQELIDMSTNYSPLQPDLPGSCTVIPHRTSNTAWSDTEYPIAQGEDASHFLFFQSTCGDNLTDGDPSFRAVPEGVNISCCDLVISRADVQIQQPSSCSSADGSIRELDIRTAGGTAPIERHLELNGVLFNPPNGSMSGLTPGVYCYVYEDAIGCRADSCFELTFEDVPVIHGVNITDACLGTSSGSIEVAMEIQGSEDSYTFNWSTGFTETHNYISTLSGVGAGSYAVTITNDLVPECEVVYFYEVGEVEIEAPTLAVDFDLKRPCLGKANGAIRLSINGGVEPIEIIWDDIGTDPSIREGLAAGEYCFTIVDRCGQEAQNCIALASNLSVTASGNSHCGGGTLSASATGGNPPYEYLWSNGFTGASLAGIPSGNYWLTVTDQNGCGMPSNIVVLDNPEISIGEITGSCKGINEGSIELAINNPNNDMIELLVNGNIFSPDHPEDFIITDLAPGLYAVELIMGECTLFQEIEVIEQATERVFSHVTAQDNEEFCVFDQLCNGQVIAEESAFEIVNYPLIPIQNPFEKCRAEGFCHSTGDRAVSSITMPKLDIPVEAYRVLIHSLVSAGRISEAEAQLLLAGLGNSGNECNKLRFCPLTLAHDGYTWLIDQHASGLSIDENGCLEVNCRSFLVSDYNVCDDPAFQLVMGIQNVEIDASDSEPDIPESCAVVDYPVAQIALWHQQFIDRFDNDDNPSNDYSGSTLFDFIVNHVLTEEGWVPEANCANVRFCQNSFTFIRSDLDFIQSCGEEYPLGGLGPNGEISYATTCELIPGTERYLCATGTNNVTTVSFEETLPSDFGENRPAPTAAPITAQNNLSGNHFFEQITFVSSDEILSPKVFVRDDAANRKYIDYFPTARGIGPIHNGVDDILDFAYDYDLEREILITRLSGDKVSVLITDQGVEQEFLLEADYNLELKLSSADLSTPDFTGNGFGQIKINGQAVAAGTGELQFGLSLEINSDLIVSIGAKRIRVYLRCSCLVVCRLRYKSSTRHIALNQLIDNLLALTIAL